MINTFKREITIHDKDGKRFDLEITNEWCWEWNRYFSICSQSWQWKFNPKSDIQQELLNIWDNYHPCNINRLPVAFNESLFQLIDELINANIFRPEFLNRFDETVLFRPLTVEELKQVVDLIVLTINKTLAAQKVSVSLTDSAKAYLAQAGYDPRLGARPLRRVTQRSIENILAQKLLSGSVAPGSVIELDAPELQAALDLRQNN